MHKHRAATKEVIRHGQTYLELSKQESDLVEELAGDGLTFVGICREPRRLIFDDGQKQIEIDLVIVTEWSSRSTRSLTRPSRTVADTWYNFCRVYRTLRVTPAMEAGTADHVWSIEEIVALLGEK